MGILSIGRRCMRLWLQYYTRPPIVTASKHLLRLYTLNPNPCMHSLYCIIVDLQSATGSAALDMSMHSSRCDFSSLHTQQGCGPC